MMMYGTPVGLTQEQEDQVTTASQTVVSNFLALGMDVIADDTNLDPLHLAQWHVVADQHYAGMEVHDMTTPVEECVARDTTRQHAVGADVIRNLATMFMPHGTYLTEDDRCDAPGCTGTPVNASWTGSGPITGYCRRHAKEMTR